MFGLFNVSPVRLTGAIEAPSEELVANTLGLHNASVEDAVRYGGDLTRAALSAMVLGNDRKYIVVDTKIHMLMPGFCPAIPGWHTDGVPRAVNGSPVGSDAPDLERQYNLRPPRYHLLVTGVGCLTQFLRPRNLRFFAENKSTRLYETLSREVNKHVSHYPEDVYEAPSCQVIEWDWWEIHQGIVAKVKEWRFLIRVTETDYLAPKTDLRQVLRTQQNVYIPREYGW